MALDKPSCTDADLEVLQLRLGRMLLDTCNAAVLFAAQGVSRLARHACSCVACLPLRACLQDILDLCHGRMLSIHVLSINIKVAAVPVGPPYKTAVTRGKVCETPPASACHTAQKASACNLWVRVRSGMQGVSGCILGAIIMTDWSTRDRCIGTSLSDCRE